MSSSEPSEIPVWTIEGYEGRFLEWDGQSWQGIDYRNYRHSFSQPEPLTSQDIEALRRAFQISTDALLDEQLVHTPPHEIRRSGQR